MVLLLLQPCAHLLMTYACEVHTALITACIVCMQHCDDRHCHMMLMCGPVRAAMLALLCRTALSCCSCVKVSDTSDAPDMLWRGLNAYNHCPLLAKDVPRHSLCEACASCGRRFLGGVEGYSSGTAGSLYCADCSDSGRGGFFCVTGSRLGAAMPAAGVQAQAAAFAAGEARARSPFL